MQGSDGGDEEARSECEEEGKREEGEESCMNRWQNRDVDMCFRPVVIFLIWDEHLWRSFRGRFSGFDRKMGTISREIIKSVQVSYSYSKPYNSQSFPRYMTRMSRIYPSIQPPTSSSSCNPLHPVRWRKNEIHRSHK